MITPSKKQPNWDPHDASAQLPGQLAAKTCGV